MYSLLFRNRWIALGWVGLTLISAASFARKDGGAAQIGQSVKQVQAQRAVTMLPDDKPHVVMAPPPPELAPDPLQLRLRAPPGSSADPMNAKVGEVFVDPVTGKRYRAVRRGDPLADAQASQPALAPSPQP